MSDRAIRFVEDWIDEHIQADVYLAESGNDDRPPRYAEQCIQAAIENGISRDEVEEYFPDLPDTIGRAMEAATDAEIARQVAKDD